MTPAEADQHIILSRKTLLAYLRMMKAGHVPANDLHLMTNEITELEGIAHEHPVKAEKAYRLAEHWAGLMTSIRAKMN